jgi:hypothetical protein
MDETKDETTRARFPHGDRHANATWTISGEGAATSNYRFSDAPKVLCHDERCPDSYHPRSGNCRLDAIFQESLSNGEVVLRFKDAGVLAEYAPCLGESVFTELAGCLNLTQRKEGGGEIVRGINGVAALVTEDSPGTRKRIGAELPRRLMLTKPVQVAGEIRGEAYGPNMVLAKYLPCAG